jgi:hypothetical protein
VVCSTRLLHDSTIMLSRLDVRDPYHNPTNMMHHHQPQSAMNATTHSTPSDSLTQAVTRLLSRASSLPCSAAFGAFQKLVPDPDKFRLSLEVLLPVLSGAHAEVSLSFGGLVLILVWTECRLGSISCQLTDRILSAYLLFALYAPHPFSLNPFKSALTEAFIHERDEAREASSRGQVHSNEQLVWVIWKILRGEGNDVRPPSFPTLSFPLLYLLKVISLDWTFYAYKPFCFASPTKIETFVPYA